MRSYKNFLVSTDKKHAVSDRKQHTSGTRSSTYSNFQVDEAIHIRYQCTRNTFTEGWVTASLLQKTTERQQLKGNTWQRIHPPRPRVLSYLTVLHYQMENVDQLRDRVALLYDDLPCPVGQHLVPILHPGRHSRGQDGHCLSDNCSSFHRMGLEKTVKNLKPERNSSDDYEGLKK